MALVSAGNGDELVAFDPGMSLAEAEHVCPVSLTFAVVIARYQGDTLFVYNRRRQEWELPAGWIEPDETPEDTAVREVYEESGQQIIDLRFAGMVLLRLASNQQFELGAAYTAEIETEQRFTENDEIEALMLWDLQQPVAEPVNAIAQYLARAV